MVQPFFRVIVELGYDRSHRQGKPTAARLVQRFDPVKVAADLVNAIRQGVNNALALTGTSRTAVQATSNIRTPGAPSRVSDLDQ